MGDGRLTYRHRPPLQRRASRAFPLSRCPVVPLSRCPVVPLSRCPAFLLSCFPAVLLSRATPCITTTVRDMPRRCVDIASTRMQTFPDFT
ncbi:hypothetical protein E9536_12985 [Burkholderia sp. LS-044]|nr:hypothetical protein E9536_12985 [Burkholderia sp. LS-044]